MDNKNLNSENKDKDFLEELSFFDKIKHSFVNLKTKSQEQKVALEKELAQKQLNKTKKELEKMIELEKAAQEKLQREKEELERKKVEAQEKAKRLEEQRLKLEEEEKQLALLKEEQEKKEKEERRIAELQKIKEEEKRETKEREDKLRKELEKEKALEEKRLKQESIEKEKKEKEEALRLEREEKENQRKLVNEQLEKEQREKLEKIEKEKQETLKLKQEREALLSQMKEVSKTTELEKKETRKIKLEKTTTEKELLDSEEILYKKEAQIEEERLRLVALNKLNSDDKTKQSISKKEEHLRKLLAERKAIKRDILLRKKQLEKDNREIVREEKITTLIDDFKEFKNIKQHVNKDGETNFSIKEDDIDRNVFTTGFHTIIYYISKYIFKKELDAYSYVRKTRHHIKLKLFLSVFATIVTVLFLLLIMKLSATPKDSYGEFYSSNTTTSTVTINNATSQQESTQQTENNTNNDVTDAANKEENDAKNTSNYNPGVTGVVSRDIKTLGKLNLYNSASWSDTSSTIDPGTNLKVNLISSPGGYMMYRIADGVNAGKFISANPKLVEIVSNSDSQNYDYINYPLSITILQEQDIFNDKELTSVKSKANSNSTLRAKGYGVSNNRLIYHLEDNSYLPFNINIQQR